MLGSGSSTDIVTSENIFDIVRILQSSMMFSYERISFNKRRGERKSILKAVKGMLSSESFGGALTSVRHF
jgi:hypothetical protein